MLQCKHTMLKTNQRFFPGTFQKIEIDMIRETLLSLTENVSFDVFLKYDLLLSSEPSAGFWNKFRNSIFEYRLKT